ncbi:hypothetical protein [Actinophytocola sp.]|uniref:hypothetical protein n=1 Tax=Actinophytocola sp. TaxID=1872138 RepID=UPI003D6BD62E
MSVRIWFDQPTSLRASPDLPGEGEDRDPPAVAVWFAEHPVLAIAAIVGPSSSRAAACR